MKLYKGDCLQVMEGFEANSIDFIICDLPYGNVTACEWDVVIPFHELWKQYKEILKPNGAICLFGTEPFSSIMKTTNLDDYKYDWIWLKKTSMNFIQANNMPLRRHENISVFSEGVINHKDQSGKDRMPYNPQNIKLEESVMKRGANVAGYSQFRGGSTDEQYEKTHEGFPTMILEGFEHDKDRFHPTQKPVKLYEYLIKTYSNPGAVVLDNCAGSGTLGEACFNLGDRDAIMIELDDEYIQAIQDRMKCLGANLEVIESIEPIERKVVQKSKAKNSKYVSLNVSQIEQMKADGKTPGDISEELGIKWAQITQSLSKRYKKPFNRM